MIPLPPFNSFRNIFLTSNSAITSRFSFKCKRRNFNDLLVVMSEENPYNQTATEKLIACKIAKIANTIPLPIVKTKN